MNWNCSVLKPVHKKGLLRTRMQKIQRECFICSKFLQLKICCKMFTSTYLQNFNFAKTILTPKTKQMLIIWISIGIWCRNSDGYCIAVFFPFLKCECQRKEKKGTLKNIQKFINKSPICTKSRFFLLIGKFIYFYWNILV